jgi:hypothetical protein
VSPGQALILGAATTVKASRHDLTAGAHYLGLVQYNHGTDVLGETIVSVNPQNRWAVVFLAGTD